MTRGDFSLNLYLHFFPYVYLLHLFSPPPSYLYTFPPVFPSFLLFSLQRRDYRVLAEFLPPKQEYVLSIRLSPLQDKLYRRYIDHESGYHTASDLFSTFANLSKVDHTPFKHPSLTPSCPALSNRPSSPLYPHPLRCGITPMC